MTTYQQQCLLGYMGYSPGPIDGEDGPLTDSARKAFTADYGSIDMLIDAVAGNAEKIIRSDNSKGSYPEAEQYLCADGYYRIPKGLNVRLTKNFWSGEFDCQGVGCCTTTVIKKTALLTWQEIRDDIGEPLPVGGAGGSGFRCPVHNADPSVGGAANSLHLNGAAADLHYKDPAKLKAAALRHVQDGEVGVYRWGCHVGEWERGYVSQFTGK